MKNLIPTLLLFTLVACGSKTETTTTKQDTPAANPIDSFYLTAAPADPIEVSALRSLESGTEVTVRGEVQNYAPVEGKAIFSLYDHALKSCNETPDDACATPWDFCCEDDTKIAKSSAMVEFRNEGKIVDASLKGFHGIDHLTDVVITGTLHLDDAGNARIVANGVHVE